MSDEWKTNPACPPGMVLVTEGVVQNGDWLWDGLLGFWRKNSDSPNWDDLNWTGQYIVRVRDYWSGPFACARPVKADAPKPDDLHERVEALVQWFWAKDSNSLADCGATGCRYLSKLPADRTTNTWIAFHPGHGFPAQADWDVATQRWVDHEKQTSGGGAEKSAMGNGLVSDAPPKVTVHQPPPDSLTARVVAEVNKRLSDGASVVDDGAMLVLTVVTRYPRPTNTDEAQAVTDAIVKGAKR